MMFAMQCQNIIGDRECQNFADFNSMFCSWCNSKSRLKSTYNNAYLNDNRFKPKEELTKDQKKMVESFHFPEPKKIVETKKKIDRRYFPRIEPTIDISKQVEEAIAWAKANKFPVDKSF